MRNAVSVLLIIFGCLSLFLAKPQVSVAGGDDALNAGELVAAHVKSLGNPKTLAKVRSRMFIGSSEVKVIQGANWTVKGNSMFVAEGGRLGLHLQYLDVNYPGEYFAYDGKEVTVKYVSPGQKSPIADFIFRFDSILKEGLLGGVMSTSWPLLSDEKLKSARMKCRKTEVDGRDLYELEYRPRNGVGNMKILMYFDPATSHHVRTEYRVRDRDDATSGSNYLESAMTHIGDIGRAREDSFYRLVEKFEEYGNVSGMALPHRYMIEYSQEGGAGAFIAHWTATVGAWTFNAPNLDDKLFQAQK